MPIPLTAQEVLDREFLEIRARILQVAAAFDRLDRADGDVDEDPRVGKLRQGLAILAEDVPGRAEQIQLVFSREYLPNWRETFMIENR
jgi:hypothetical protein